MNYRFHIKVANLFMDIGANLQKLVNLCHAQAHKSIDKAKAIVDAKYKVN